MSIEKKWVVGKFLIGLPPAEQETRTGLLYRGLGIFHAYDDAWSLTHLNSGHKAFTLYGLFGNVLEPATAIAEAVDWSFKGLEGWKSDGEAFLARLDAATAPFGDKIAKSASATNRSDKIAADIAALRSA